MRYPSADKVPPMLDGPTCIISPRMSTHWAEGSLLSSPPALCLPLSPLPPHLPPSLQFRPLPPVPAPVAYGLQGKAVEKCFSVWIKLSFYFICFFFAIFHFLFPCFLLFTLNLFWVFLTKAAQAQACQSLLIRGKNLSNSL